MKTDSLVLRGIRKSMADFTLTADFEIKAGERAALSGPSGFGKTTLLRMIAGLESIPSGSLFLGGEEITHLEPRRRRVGFVFQDHCLFPSMNVLENVVFGLRMQGVGKREREKIGNEWLDRVGLSHRIKSSVTTLSGGEAQRVAFARALVPRPRILLLDEPFASLDDERRGELRRILKLAHESWPVPLLLVSHDQRDIDDLVTVRLEVKTECATSVRSVYRPSPA